MPIKNFEYFLTERFPYVVAPEMLLLLLTHLCLEPNLFFFLFI